MRSLRCRYNFSLANHPTIEQNEHSSFLLTQHLDCFVHLPPRPQGRLTRCRFFFTLFSSPSTSSDSYCHFLPCRHSPPHLFDLHLGHGKWQPGQSSSRQSHRSSLLSMRRPLSS